MTLQGNTLTSILAFTNGDKVTVETLRQPSDVETIARHRASIRDVCLMRGVTPVYAPVISLDRLH